MLIDMYIILFSLIQVAVLGVTVMQDQLSWTKPEGKSVYISCKVTELTTDYIHWYQQKDGEAITRILYIKNDGTGLNNAQAKDFTVSVDKKSNLYSLKIDTLKKSHSAVYYCACWETGVVRKIFGEGTRLYVTGDEVNIPTLTVYPVVNLPSNKSLLLCQATEMYPDLVRFTWKDDKTQIRPEEVLEQKIKDADKVKSVTSMLIIDLKNVNSKEITCHVQHDSSSKNENLKKTIQIGQNTQLKRDPNPDTAQNCIQHDKDTDFDSPELFRKLYLFNLTYVSLIVKNVLYFLAVCVLLYKRSDGNQEK